MILIHVLELLNVSLEDQALHAPQALIATTSQPVEMELATLVEAEKFVQQLTTALTYLQSAIQTHVLEMQSVFQAD